MNHSVPINLESLLELSSKLTESNNEIFILNSALLSIMGKLKIFRACVLKPDDDNKSLIPLIIKGRQYFSSISTFDCRDFRKLDSINETDLALMESGYSYISPVRYKDRLYAVFCFGDSFNPEFDETELNYIRIVSNITANALQISASHNSILNSKSRIEQRNQLLNALFEMSREFSSLLSRKQIIKMLSYRLMGQLMVSRFAVILVHNGIKEIIINKLEKSPDDDIIENLTQTMNIIQTENPDEQSHLKNILFDSGIRILSPMNIHGEVKGFLLLSKKMNGEDYTDDNIQFIEALGNTAISALENERLFQEELEKKKLESEMEMALEIQLNLLPKKLPHFSNLELAAMSNPSRLVGGDYYDFILLSGERLLITIADVSGKGMPAALLMANVQAALRVLAPLQISLTELVLRLNNIVYHNTSPDRFVSFFCCIVDTQSGIVNYINAGHNPPLLLSNGMIQRLTKGGILLGLFDDPPEYEESCFDLHNGDSILFYTDGITESLNIEENEYGEDKLIEEFVGYSDENASAIINKILYSVQKHSDGVPQYDDITICLLKYGNTD